MITGKLNDLVRYKSLSPLFEKAIEYVLTHDLINLEPGQYEIEGKDIYLMRDTYEPKPMADCFFEGHKKYADLQIVLSGEEGFGYLHAEEAYTLTDPYNDEKDVVKMHAAPYTVYPLKAGHFAIVFPEDLHMVKIKQAEGYVNKVVVKIKL